MFITSQHQAASTGQLPNALGATRYWLVGEEICGSQQGRASLLVVPSTMTYPLTSSTVESGSVVLSGKGEVLGGERLSQGSVIQSCQGSQMVVRAGAEGMTLLTIHGGSTGASPEPSQSFEAGTATPADRSRTFVLDDVIDKNAHSPELGFFGMKARLLIDGASGGGRSFILGMGTFAPATGCHGLHRHRNAEEIFYVWQGHGMHLTGDGAAHPISAGELVFVPRNEWHGFRNTGEEPVRAFFAYLGVDSVNGAGYELKDAPL